MQDDPLDGRLLARILMKLGLDQQPPPSLEGLQTLYTAWCRAIPFDNLLKRIHLESALPGPLPGNDPVPFFEEWLRHGVGGTCWAGSNGLYALLDTLGFRVQRGLATMHVARHGEPNHGTIIATCGGISYLVDTSMLHHLPLRLASLRQNGVWQLRWTPLHLPNGCIFTLNRVGVSREFFAEMNERTIQNSPFNSSVYVRIHRGDRVTGLAFGHRVTIHRQGRIERQPVNLCERDRFLHQEAGFTMEIIRKIPPDRLCPGLAE